MKSIWVLSLQPGGQGIWPLNNPKGGGNWPKKGPTWWGIWPKKKWKMSNAWGSAQARGGGHGHPWNWLTHYSIRWRRWGSHFVKIALHLQLTDYLHLQFCNLLIFPLSWRCITLFMQCIIDYLLPTIGITLYSQMFAKTTPTVKVNSICSIAAAVSVIKLANWLNCYKMMFVCWNILERL